MYMVCVYVYMKIYLEILKVVDEVCGYLFVKNSCFLYNLKIGKY